MPPKPVGSADSLDFYRRHMSQVFWAKKLSLRLRERMARTAALEEQRLLDAYKSECLFWLTSLLNERFASLTAKRKP
jgi:hypothetical protein